MSRISSFYMLGYIIFEQDSPGGAVVKNLSAIAGDPRDMGSIPGWKDPLGWEDPLE